VRAVVVVEVERLVVDVLVSGPVLIIQVFDEIGDPVLDI
jgi:hypothetical protein